ncbi:pirin family protein [Parasediminibacterium sp. JCM 36343]|uniref:pirin family protein n=1 Tax=Parasediminibacterium sp. JCM 36343 TaxID=3374279 RepID=UPI00397B1CC8
MKTILHKANTRGHANHGWLNSYHTFSFAGYHEPSRVHFGALRVLNDDTVAAGMGFGKHPHDNMEIVSIPLSGDLEHNDTTGRHEIIKEGDVQIMTAGKGLSHSEKNANHNKEVKFLQIWVLPKEKNIAPRYEQKSFPLAERKNQLQTVVAPDDANAVWINQNAWFTLGSFDKDNTTSYQLHNTNSGVYAFVIKGSISLNGVALEERDGLGITDTATIDIKADTDTEVLLIEVPMQI